ncbi:MAG: nitrous oxide reductase family maturation protein NosD [Myxococcales bacterium]|nr:nitrous oxide reductase family maturation protein NosD [Myxococcales bacterium]
MRLALVLGAALAGAIAGLTALAGALAHPRALGPLDADAHGPVERAIPEGATVAHDEAELAALLADAAGPREIWLEGHVYRGNWTVSRPLALRGVGGSVLEGRGTGTVVTLEAQGSELENVTVRHSGRNHVQEDAGVKARARAVRIARVAVEDALFGIALSPCPGCTLEQSSVVGAEGDSELQGDGIKLWEAHGAVVRGCLVDRARDMVVWYSRGVVLLDNTVRRSRYGAHFMYSHDGSVLRNRFENDIVGVFVMYSSRLSIADNHMLGASGAAGVGIGFKESDGATLRGNVVAGNTTGVYLDRSPRSAAEPLELTGNVFAANQVGIRFHGSDVGLHFVRNDFRQNVALAEVEGGGSARTVVFRNNHFSDYAGYDLDGDGVGDVPFQQKRLARDLTVAHPPVRLLEGTAAMSLVEAIAAAAPAMASELLLEDRAPATSAWSTL